MLLRGPGKAAVLLYPQHIMTKRLTFYVWRLISR